MSNERCPKCGRTIRKKLSFCPNCGEVIRIQQETVVRQAKKKRSIWKILFVLLLLVAVSNAITNQGKKEDVVKKEDASKDKNRKDKKQNVKYHGDSVINQIITEYNDNAEIKITTDMVSNGAYHFNAKVSINDVGIIIYNSGGNVFIDYRLEDENDNKIFSLFRDFAVVLNPDITKKEIKQGFKELRTNKYQAYTEYDMMGILCTYSCTDLNGGGKQYLVKTKYSDYIKKK